MQLAETKNDNAVWLLSAAFTVLLVVTLGLALIGFITYWVAEDVYQDLSVELNLDWNLSLLNED